MNSWIFIKCLLLAAYGYAVFYFCHSLLEAKRSPRIAAVAIILYEILFNYLFLDKLLKTNYYLSIFISKLGLVLIILLLFQGSPCKKLAISSVIYVIQELTTYAIVPLLTRSADLIADYVFNSELPIYVIHLIFVIQYCISCLIIYKVSRNCSNLSKNVPQKLSMLLLVPSVFILLVLEFASYVCNDQQLFLLLSRLYEMPFSLLYQLADPVILFLLSSFGLAANLIIVFRTNLAMQQLLTEQQLSMQITHYQELEKQDLELRRIRHDLKNHIISLQGLLTENNVDSARDYLVELAGKSSLSESLIKTGNHTTDAVINAKYHEAQQSGIDFNCDINLPVIEISDFDICVILGNAIDNAIEACNRIVASNSKKFISLKSSVVKSYLILEIKNSIPNQYSEYVSLITKKDQSRWHGIGLKSIKDTVEKYQGMVDITIKPEIFCMSIMLPK